MSFWRGLVLLLLLVTGIRFIALSNAEVAWTEFWYLLVGCGFLSAFINLLPTGERR